MRRTNRELADLLQNLSNALSDREGRDSIHLDNDDYLNGVKKAVPEIEKALKGMLLSSVIRVSLTKSFQKMENCVLMRMVSFCF